MSSPNDTFRISFGEYMVSSKFGLLILLHCYLTAIQTFSIIYLTSLMNCFLFFRFYSKNSVFFHGGPGNPHGKQPVVGQEVYNTLKYSYNENKSLE